MRLQYVGFQHVQNVREYTFHGVEQGEPTKTFVVRADLDLFRRNRVGMQEGPAMCLRLLTTALSDAVGSPPSRHIVTDKDMMAYLIARAVPSGAKQRAARGG